jgi:hypothetical protein
MRIGYLQKSANIQRKRSEQKRQQATRNKQQAGMPRRAKGRKSEWAKGRGQQATGNKQQAGMPRKRKLSPVKSAHNLPFLLQR